MSRPLLSDDDVLPFFLAVGGTCVVLSVALFLVWRYRLSLCFFPPWSRKSAEGAGPGGPAGEGESADYDEAEYNYAYGDGDDDYQYGDDERAWPWPGARPEGESAEDFYNDEAELEQQQGDDDDEEDSGDARQSREVVSPRPRPPRSSRKSRSSASGSRSSSSLAKKKQPDEHLSAAGPAAKYYQTAREEVRRSRAGAADPGEGAAATEKDHPRRSPHRLCTSGEMAMCKGDEDVNLD